MEVQFSNNTKYTYHPPNSTNITLCFIPGFQSDFLSSNKSRLIHEIAIQHNWGFLSWNHSGMDSIYAWFQEGLRLIKCYKERIYIIGASCGLWIALLIAMETDIEGIMGIGGGVDVTEEWLGKEISIEDRNNRNYIWKRRTDYNQEGFYSIPITFLLDSRPALLMHRPCPIRCPVLLIHGQADNDVSILHARELYRHLNNNDHVSLVEIEDGDHRLSRSQDLDFIRNKLLAMIIE
ncbi:Alpha/Beta hydrolase protein [Pilobolus umbonatus]|nr:Alpha/Beta hydrolase protein [Pilobolus umbonatus]